MVRGPFYIVAFGCKIEGWGSEPEDWAVAGREAETTHYECSVLFRALMIGHHQQWCQWEWVGAVDTRSPPTRQGRQVLVMTSEGG